jgi:anthranilate phosphoribosyltransferase
MIVRERYELAPFIRRCVAGDGLSSGEMEALITAITDGATSPAQTAALLVALSLKGESLGELVGAARALRARATVLPNAVRPDIDVCGTGGDGCGTFNISTAVAFVVAAAGVTVAKHGNRAVSGRCGSADAMEALDVRIDVTPQTSAALLERHGIAFLFAQAYHPALRVVASVRSEIGVRTLFNLLGPLINPAHPRRQLVGVAERAAMRTMARALAVLGVHHGAIVRAEDGMDEVSLCAPTDVIAWEGEHLSEQTITPESLGLRRAPASALGCADAQDSARIVRGVLDGAHGPARDVVLLNAALALRTAGTASDLFEGLAQAARAIDSGAARGKLQALVEATSR